MLIDVSRSLWRAWRGAPPTGIDRVCMAYVARYRSHARAVVQRGGMRRVLSPRASAAAFDAIVRAGTGARAGLLVTAARAVPTLLRSISSTGQPYLNVGHTGLDRPGFRRWVSASGVRPIYMIHDLIPLTHPEYARPGEPGRHAARVATMLDTGVGIIANSAATRESLAAWARTTGRAMPPTIVAWLGAEPLATAEPTPPLSSPYFVTLGTIEGRKNHLLLLNIWRAMAQRLGSATPKLVVIGRRGWEATQATAMLDRCAALRDHVIEIPACDDAMLARYLAHAAALLFPSFVEGYGLPLVEALAIGTPVIASDLPVFRELAGDIPCYRDPNDGPGWIDAIIDYADGSVERTRQREAIRGYRAPDWPTHFDAVEAWMATLG